MISNGAQKAPMAKGKTSLIARLPEFESYVAANMSVNEIADGMGIKMGQVEDLRVAWMDKYEKHLKLESNGGRGILRASQSSISISRGRLEALNADEIFPKDQPLKLEFDGKRLIITPAKLKILNPSMSTSQEEQKSPALSTKTKIDAHNGPVSADETEHLDDEAPDLEDEENSDDDETSDMDDEAPEMEDEENSDSDDEAQSNEPSIADIDIDELFNVDSDNLAHSDNSGKSGKAKREDKKKKSSSSKRKSFA